MKSDTVTKGKQQAPHRSLFNALGLTKEEELKEQECEGSCYPGSHICHRNRLPWGHHS